MKMYIVQFVHVKQRKLDIYFIKKKTKQISYPVGILHKHKTFVGPKDYTLPKIGVEVVLCIFLFKNLLANTI